MLHFIAFLALFTSAMGDDNTDVLVWPFQAAYSPPLGSGWYYWNSVCGSTDTYSTGLFQTVSWRFFGTSVTVNLAATAHGTVAQIVLDGVNVTRLDTYSTADNGCPDTTVSWKSPDLNFGWHDITAMSIQPGSNYYSQGLDDVGFMFFQNFIYNSGYPHPPSPPPPPPKKHFPLGGIIGAAVGGAAVIVVGILAIVLCCRRRRRHRAHEGRQNTPSARYISDGEKPDADGSIPYAVGYTPTITDSVSMSGATRSTFPPTSVARQPVFVGAARRDGQPGIVHVDRSSTNLQALPSFPEPATPDRSSRASDAFFPSNYTSEPDDMAGATSFEKILPPGSTKAAEKNTTFASKLTHPMRTLSGGKEVPVS